MSFSCCLAYSISAGSFSAAVKACTIPAVNCHKIHGAAAEAPRPLSRGSVFVTPAAGLSVWASFPCVVFRNAKPTNSKKANVRVFRYLRSGETVARHVPSWLLSAPEDVGGLGVLVSVEFICVCKSAFTYPYHVSEQIFPS
jgi:hypothetical protein